MTATPTTYTTSYTTAFVCCILFVRGVISHNLLNTLSSFQLASEAGRHLAPAYLPGGHLAPADFFKLLHLTSLNFFY